LPEVVFLDPSIQTLRKFNLRYQKRLTSEETPLKRLYGRLVRKFSQKKNFCLKNVRHQQKKNATSRGGDKAV